MRVCLPLLSLPLLLAACATSGERTPRFLHEVPAGTVLALERPVPFAAGQWRAYFQDGRLYSGYGIFGRGGVNRYRAHCILELSREPDADRTLSVREYRLAAVRWDVTYLAMDDSEFRTQWRLAGGGEPQAHSFACYKIGNAAFERHLTLEEIDRVVGDYFRLKKADAR